MIQWMREHPDQSDFTQGRDYEMFLISFLPVLQGELKICSLKYIVTVSSSSEKLDFELQRLPNVGKDQNPFSLYLLSDDWDSFLNLV